MTAAELARERVLILGETDYRGQHWPFGLLAEDRLRHVWVIGKTGSGKSTLLSNLIRQDLARGEGFAVLDPHGDLVDAIASAVPNERINDVLLLEPEDKEWCVSWNVFRDGRRVHADPALLASHLISVFKKQWPEFFGPRTEHILRNAILAVAGDPRATLVYLYKFLTDEPTRDRVVAAVTDPLVRQFWTKEWPSYSKALAGEALAPVTNKIGAFVSNSTVRNIVGQERSRVDLGEFMQQKKILLVRLPTGAIGEDASGLLGGLILTSLQLAAMARERGGPPFTAYVDEFQNFVTDSLSTLLSEARKFGLPLVLAHQYVAQLRVPVRDAILGNIGTSIVFRLGGADAELLENEFRPELTALDLQRLPPFRFVVKLLCRGAALTPFTAKTLPPPAALPDAKLRLERVRAQSRLRYAQPRTAVETAISAAFPPD